jgi:hypothetical protein
MNEVTGQLKMQEKEKGDKSREQLTAPPLSPQGAGEAKTQTEVG